MDAKEAIEIVKENILQIKELQNMFTGKINTKFLMAIEALEKVEALYEENARLRKKETPKEPIMKEGNNRDLFCSICGARVSDVADRIINSDNLQKYCGVCGQKLDWLSDKE